MVIKNKQPKIPIYPISSSKKSFLNIYEYSKPYPNVAIIVTNKKKTKVIMLNKYTNFDQK